ncbi:hypothetical protein FRC09_009216 [Ceratobasidium sp. 395]|nr:hypothetical protein FRC09_009216 [Ceratobasidium sp. 395]
METLNRWVTAQSHLKEAAASFLDACLALRKAAAQSFPSHPNHLILENMLHDVQSRISSIGVVENCMHESRAVLNALLNISTSRVPINRLPPEILGRIFSIAVASSPCAPEHGKRDSLLDILLVCTRWCQLATSNRSLWSHIDINSGRAGHFGLHRVRLWLERSQGAPIHIHVTGDTFQADEPAIQHLVSILQPHAMFTSSLVLSERHAGLIRSLLALYLNQSGSGTLNTLVVADRWSRNITFPWPTYPMRALVVLELRSIQGLGCPVLEELVAMLSDCPKLHTLRLVDLRTFTARSEQLLNQGFIILPCLKLLQIEIPGGQALAELLAVIQPGELELDVRLSIGPIDGGPVLRNAQSLLRRSNVVSLTLADFRSPNIDHFQSFFSSMPYLRGLRINSTGAGSLLSALANEAVTESLSNLQSLCISGGEVDSPLLNRIISFSSFYNEQEGTDEGEDLTMNDEGDEEAEEAENQVFVPGSPLYHKDIPYRAKTLLLEHVERLVVCETPPVSIINGVDVSVQEMIKTG